MPVISSIFLVIALTLAVVLGPQTRPWSWGPAMMALGISVLAALPVIWKRGKAPADFAILALGVLAAGWFAWRAWISPVAELGQADLLLVAGAVGAFVGIRAIAGNARAEALLIWGIALLLLANEVVIGFQLIDPSFTPVFKTRASDQMISGFFAHYNEAANYLIASSMLVGAAAFLGRHATLTRVLWLLIAVAGLAGVWFTRSRGGILGGAIGCGILATTALVIGKRREARWFAPLLIAIPVIGLGVGAFLCQGWQEAQESRQAGTGIAELLDNDCRFYFLGIALSCIGLHPMSGGGARSFSWECFRFWENNVQGAGGAKPDMVHNELVQSATDYGIVGAGLIIALLAALALVAVLRVAFEERPAQPDSRDAWRLGALAALAGMLVQSCFSFVFHLMPGILLLGICLGQMSRSTPRIPGPQILGTRILLTLACLFSVVLLLPAGWKGIQVSRILWPTHFSKQPQTSDESRIDALTEAIQIWPQSTFYLERATILQETVISFPKSDLGKVADRAISDYREAATLHPFDPTFAVNQANLLSKLNRDDEAESSFATAIQLQGGMESGFRSHYCLATHYLGKGTRIFDPLRPEPANEALELAAEHIEKAISLTPPWVIGNDGSNLRISIHESLGTVRETLKDRQGALQSYDFASAIPSGQRAHYRAGVLIGKQAVDAWMKRRPSEAFYLFMEARKRIGQAGNQLPAGVTPSQRVEYLAYLDERIAFFKRTKVEPAK